MLRWIFSISGIVMLVIYLHDMLISRKEKRTAIPLPISRFSVPDYLERTDRLCCELSEDNEFIPIELWWGYEGWRSKPDGSFEKVTRWKEKKPEFDFFASQNVNALANRDAYSYSQDMQNCCCQISEMQRLQSDIRNLQLQAAQASLNASIMNQIGYMRPYGYAPQMTYLQWNSNAWFRNECYRDS